MYKKATLENNIIPHTTVCTFGVLNVAKNVHILLVNFCQMYLFLHQLTNYKLRICCVHKLFFTFFVLTFSSIYVHNMFWVWNFHVLNSRPGTRNSMNNLLSHYGLFDAKISASEKDLPVHRWCQTFFEAFLPQVSRFHWWSTYWSSNTKSYWLKKNGP